MAFSINGNSVDSWSDVLQNAVSGDAVGVSSETVSGYALTGQTLANGVNCTVTGTTFSGNSNTARGGALLLAGGTSTIDDSVFSGNSTDSNDGGALHVGGATVTITDTLFSGNTVYTGSNYHGGAIRNSGTLTLDGVTISENGARTGGGIYNDGRLILRDVLLTGNTAAYGGGALRNNGGSVSLAGVTFSGNFTNNGTQTAMRNSGPMSIDGFITIGVGEEIYNEGAITVDGSKFITGDAFAVVKVVDADGAWYTKAGSGSISATEGYGLIWGDDQDLYVINAEAADYLVSTDAEQIPGFDLYRVTDAVSGKNYVSANVESTPEAVSGSVVIDGITYTGALTVTGTNSYTGINGAIFAGGANKIEPGSGTHTTFAGLTFRDYVGANNGSVIETKTSSGKTLTIRDCLFENNTTSGSYSGAIHVYYATTDISNSVFRNNSTTHSKGYGGVIQCNSAMTVSGSIFEYNTAYMGGALAVWTNANITVSDTVFDHNFASSSGGAVYAEAGAVAFTDVWFNGNTSKIGGALCNKGGSVTLNGVTFTDNALISGSDGKAIYNYANGTIAVTGEIVLGSGQRIKNSGTVTVDGAAFLVDGRSIARVVDAQGTWLDGTAFVTGEGYELLTIDNDLYVTAGGEYVNVDYLVTNDGTATVAFDAATGVTYLAAHATNSITAATGKVVLDNFLYEGTSQISLNPNVRWTGINNSVVSIQDASATGTIRFTGAGYAIFEGMTFSDSVATKAAVLNIGYSGGTASVNHSLFDSNTAGVGGVFNLNGRLFIDGSTFSNNSATGGNGGVVQAESGKTISIADSLFVSNSSSNYSGTVHMNAGNVQVSGSTFLNNSAKYGGVSYNSGTLTVSDSVFGGNSASENGGAFYNTSATSSETFTGSTFLNNVAKNGGGLSLEGGALSFTDVVFSGNTAASSGGAVYVKTSGSSASFTNVWFDGNTAQYGGAFRSASGTTVTLSGVTFTDNKSKSSSDGHAFYSEGTINVAGLVVMGSGQILWNRSAMTVQGENFLSGSRLQSAMVIDASNGYSQWYRQTAAAELSATTGNLFVTGQDLMITNADAVFAGNSVYGNVYTDLGAALAAESSVLMLTDYSGAVLTVDSTTTLGSDGATLNSDITVNAGGSLTLSGLVLNASISGEGAVGVASGTELVFANTSAVSVTNLNFAADSALVIGAGLVNFTAQDLSDVALTVDGSQFVDTPITVATGVTAIGDDYTVVDGISDHLKLKVDGTDLVLYLKADVDDDTYIDGGFTGGTSNLMTGGTITGAYVGIRNPAANADVENVVTGGTIGNALIGGALVSQGSTATLGTVSLTIAGVTDIVGGEANGGMLYTAGYAYGAEHALHGGLRLWRGSECAGFERDADRGEIGAESY